MIKTVETQYLCEVCEYIGHEVVEPYDNEQPYQCTKCSGVLESVEIIVNFINVSRCGGDYQNICDDNQVDWHCICGEHEEIVARNRE